jgi:hypothetical protein
LGEGNLWLEEGDRTKKKAPSGREVIMSVIESTRKSPFNPSSTLLEMHMTELEEECARFLSLITALRTSAQSSHAADEEERDTLEAEIYASLSHMKNHVEPAMEEMDRLIEEMPDDEDEETQ